MAPAAAPAPGAGARLASVTVDAADPPALARWWARALDWRPGYADDQEVDVDPPEGEAGVPLVFVPVREPKRGPNRVHLDLDTSSPADQRQTVEFLLDSGARRADVGQGQVPWVVLADPEGNEFCVLDPRPEYEGCGRVAAIVVQALRPQELAQFWAPLAGWRQTRWGPSVAALRDGRRGPYLEFVRTTTPHSVKNRWHLDVRPTSPPPGQDRVVREARAAGARPVDVGQHPRVSWVVLADPEGNEFCVLSGRGG
ncbi:VOC family protein [Kineococcus esterisolvens]|uniref:VOC family protein n=1 Tax=unclassified Kineococcus TaxID=2621656 RepID=UPI003D7CCCB1